jgi:outer membrane protein
MKKVTFLFLLLSVFVVSRTSAQISKGNMMVGGTLSLYTTSLEGNSDYESSGTEFSPSFGYFIADKLAVGGELTFIAATNDNGANKTETTYFGFAPFARYYKVTSNENFAFFAQARLRFLSGKIDTTPGGETKSSRTTFAISPGFAYFFNKHWAVDFSIAGLVIDSSDPDKDADNNKTTTIQFGLSSLSPSLGFKYHFGN